MTAKSDVVLLTGNFLIPTAWPNVLSDFLTDRQLLGARPATLSYYRTEALLFIRWAEPVGALGLADLTPEFLRAYFLSLTERRNTTGVHTAWRCLKTWLTWCWAEYDMPGACPMLKVKVAAPPSEAKQGVPLENVAKLLEVCTGPNGARDRAIILFLLDTGVRRRELCALSLGDVRGEVVTLQAANTKVGRARPAFLSRQTLRALKAYLTTREPDTLTTDAPLFATDDDDRLTVSALRAIVTRRSKLAGVPVVGLHAFRRTFGVETFKATGGDLLSTSRLLGHASVEMTRIYIKQDTGDLAEVHARSSPVSALMAGRKRGGKNAR